MGSANEISTVSPVTPFSRSTTKIESLPLSEKEAAILTRVSEAFPFRVTDYYLRLIQWDDPDDPIRRIVIPNETELEEWGTWDASGESGYTVAPGLEHKYRSTALLLLNDVCGAFCRFCFRKRLFQNDSREVTRDLTKPVEYIRAHPEIDNVLFSGGDPLMMSSGRLKTALETIASIDHIRVIRIGTKMPAFDPARVVRDDALLATIRDVISQGVRINIMVHFNHPREFTELAGESLKCLASTGARLFNQSPIIRGINAAAPVLKDLIWLCYENGVTPYYFFQCRPTLGNKGFQLTLSEVFEHVADAGKALPGFLKTYKLVMSHEYGKLEIVSVTDEQTVLRFHEAVIESNIGRLLRFRTNPAAAWFDDYLPYADLNPVPL